MKLFDYEIDGQTSLAVRHECLRCDKPVLIDTAHLRAGELYFCTYCGLDWRLAPIQVQQVNEQLAERLEHMIGVQPFSA